MADGLISTDISINQACCQWPICDAVYMDITDLYYLLCSMLKLSRSWMNAFNTRSLIDESCKSSRTKFIRSVCPFPLPFLSFLNSFFAQHYASADMSLCPLLYEKISSSPHRWCSAWIAQSEYKMRRIWCLTDEITHIQPYHVHVHSKIWPDLNT